MKKEFLFFIFVVGVAIAIGVIVHEGFHVLCTWLYGGSVSGIKFFQGHSVVVVVSSFPDTAMWQLHHATVYVEEIVGCALAFAISVLTLGYCFEFNWRHTLKPMFVASLIGASVGAIVYATPGVI